MPQLQNHINNEICLEPCFALWYLGSIYALHPLDTIKTINCFKILLTLIQKIVLKG